MSAPNTSDRSVVPLIEGVAWLLFVLFAFIYTFQFDDPLPVYDLGPAYWPRLVLGIMFVASLSLMYSRIREYRSYSQNLEVDKEQSELIARSANLRVALIFITPVLYAYLIHKMGFLLVTPFFLCGYMWLVGVRSWRTLIIMTVSIYAAIVIVFVKLIFTYLPPGAGVFHKINGMIIGLIG